MNHAIADFDASWKSIGQKPPSFAFEDRHNCFCVVHITAIKMQRAGQLTVERLRNGAHLVHVLGYHEDSQWPEDLGL